MAHISYVDIADVTDPEMRATLEKAYLGNAGETRAVYAHSPAVFKYFTTFTAALRDEGTLDAELAEVVRVRIATSWDRMFGMSEVGHGCHY